MIKSGSVRRHDHSVATIVGRILPNTVLLLLAAEILFPRVALGNDVFTLDDVIPLFVGMLGLLWVLYSGRLPRRAMILLLFLWSIIGLLTALQNSFSVEDFISLLARGSIRPLNSLFLLIMIYQLTRNRPDRITYVIHWIVWVATIQGVLAVISYAIGTIAGRPVPLLGLVPYLAQGHAVSRLVPGRFVGTANIAANFVGAYFVMTIPLTIALMLARSGKKFWYSLAVAVQLFGLIITFTRSSLISLIIVLFGLLVILRKKRLLAVYLLIGSVLSIILILAVPEYLLRFTADVGPSGRFELWRIGWRMMLDHPLLGVGFGRFMEVVQTNPIRYPARFNPHNSYIMLGAEGGGVAMLIGIGIAILYLLNLYCVFRSSTSQRGRLLSAGLLAGGAGFLLQSFTNDLLFIPHLLTYFWLYYVLGINMPRNDTVQPT